MRKLMAPGIAFLTLAFLPALAPQETQACGLTSLAQPLLGRVGRAARTQPCVRVFGLRMRESMRNRLLVFAGIWEPDPDRVFVLDVADVEVYETSDGDRRWASSLAANLEKRGGVVKAQAVFARTSARLTINGSEVEAVSPEGSERNGVFRREDEPEVFLVIHGRYWFYVDFGKREIKLIGVAATPSLHYPPSRNFVVALNGFGGLPVHDPGKSPVFEDSRVTWY